MVNQSRWIRKNYNNSICIFGYLFVLEIVASTILVAIIQMRHKPSPVGKPHVTEELQFQDVLCLKDPRDVVRHVENDRELIPPGHVFPCWHAGVVSLEEG